jgi:acyl carrier protein phosphodiesterase
VSGRHARPFGIVSLNFLAHLSLAEPGPLGLLGSLMGDFVKGPLPGRHPAPLARALWLHRRVDSFTDAHPLVRASRDRIRPPYRRFAGIMIDVVYDHFLARDWARYSDEPLAGFTSRVYALLEAHGEILPARLRAIAPLMAGGDWLGSYAHIDAVEGTLERMGGRLKRGNALRGCGGELRREYAQLERDFHAFFPVAMAFCDSLQGAPLSEHPLGGEHPARDRRCPTSA